MKCAYKKLKYSFNLRTESLVIVMEETMMFVIAAEGFWDSSFPYRCDQQCDLMP